ncbi:MAG: PRC-barrel domain-containing protein [Pirellulales bacterium]|nr:PRC-barrel domain-containing protein [Pirellulales bacterium]
MSRTIRRHALPALALLAAVAFLFSTMSLWSVLLAAEPAIPAGAPSAGDTTNETDNDNVEPQLGPIAHTGKLVKMKVADERGRLIGQVDDLLLDLGGGRIALVLVSPVDGKGQVLLPARQFVFPHDDSHLTFKASAQPLEATPRWKNEGPSTQFNRAAIADIHRRAGQKMYRVKPDAADLTAWFSGIAQQKVENTAGAEIGNVVDFAVTLPDAALAYAAVSCNCFADSEQKLFPIPLSALVVEPGAKAWILELPLDIVERTPTFAKDAWPTTIDRGWVEYVHVRYGRSPLEGVRDRLRGGSTGQTTDKP